MNERSITNARFIHVNKLPQSDSLLTAKLYFDIAISHSVDEQSLLGLDPDEKLRFDERGTILPNSTLTSPKTVIGLPTNYYVDFLHENRRIRRDVSTVNTKFDNKKLTLLDSVTVDRNPSSDNELVNKKINDGLDKTTILRFNQKLEKYPKVPVGKGTYNLTKYDKIQITDTTIIKNANTGIYLLQIWVIKCNDKNFNCETQNFMKSRKTSIPTRYSGTESSPPIGNSFVYIKTLSDIHGNNVFVSFERTDFIQNSNITLYCNRYSILTKDSLKSIGLFRIQLLLEDNTWSTRYKMAKNDRYCDTSTDWTE